MTRKIIFTSLLALFLLATGCGDNEKKYAEQLLGQAEDNIVKKNFKLALAQLDSLDSVYPKQIEVRRAGMRVRPLALEGSILQDIVTVDSIIAVLSIENEKQKEDLRFVENPVEGYYVSSKEKKGEFIGTNGIQGRISPDGFFYIVSSTTKPVKSEAIILRAGSQEARSKTVKYDEERNYRRNGVEVITFMSSECDTLGKFAETHIGEDMTLTFDGEKPYTVDFKAEDVERLAEIYSNSKLVSKSKAAQWDKARLERQLEISRHQQARTYPDSEMTEHDR